LVKVTCELLDRVYRGSQSRGRSIMLKSMFGRGSHQGGLAFVAVLVATVISFSKPLPPASNAGTASLEIGVFESQTDVGNPVNAGGASYDANWQAYVVAAPATHM